MAKNDCPCRDCDRRLVGCHSICTDYQTWKRDYEQEKAETREDPPEMSRKLKRLLWRRMLRR